MTFIDNIRTVFSADVADDPDRGDLVQTIIITAGFALAGYLMISWISTAILNKGADIASCIEGSSSSAGAKANSAACAKNHASEKSNSFSKSDGYKGRYGN
jgi:hypothetical protein